MFQLLPRGPFTHAGNKAMWLSLLYLFFTHTSVLANRSTASKKLTVTLDRNLRGADFQKEFNRQISLLHALGEKLSQKVNRLKEEESTEQQRKTTASSKFWCFFNVVSCYR